MHGLFPQFLMFSYSILTWLFICLLILKLLIDFFFGVCFVLFVFLFLLNFSFELFLFWLCLFFFTHVCYIHININTCLIFTRDIRQPLSQIRLSLSVSLGAGQIIFLAGIKATEKTVGGSLPYVVFIRRHPPWMKCEKRYFPLSFEGYLCHSGSSNAIFPDGRLLLDARRGNLPLPVCCESLQHQHQDAHVSRHLMGYFHDLFYYNMYWR